MSTVLAVMVLAIFALLGGALLLWRRGGSRRQVMLMLVLAMIAAINVASWTVPMGTQGPAPIDRQPG